MEVYIAIAVILAVGGYFIYKRADKNNDGKVDAAEVTAIKEEVKVAAQAVKTQVKKASSNVGAKTRAAVNKAASKKPAVKAKAVRRPRAK